MKRDVRVIDCIEEDIELRHVKHMASVSCGCRGGEREGQGLDTAEDAFFLTFTVDGRGREPLNQKWCSLLR